MFKNRLNCVLQEVEFNITFKHTGDRRKMRFKELSTCLNTQPSEIRTFHTFLKLANIFKRNQSWLRRHRPRFESPYHFEGFFCERRWGKRRANVFPLYTFASCKDVKRTVCGYVQEACLERLQAWANTEEIPRL